VTGNSLAAEIAGLLPHRLLVRTGGFEGTHHAIPSLLSGLGGVVAVVGCVYVTSHVHTGVEGDRVARRQGSGCVAPNELDLRRSTWAERLRARIRRNQPGRGPVDINARADANEGIDRDRTRPMLLTLKVNDLLVFVDDAGPLMITIPMASITGGAWTLIVTESVRQSCWGSQTSSWNVRVAGPVGAVNVGVAEVGSLNVTGGPAVWVHMYVRAWPAGSIDPDPSSCTDAPEATVWSGPASAIGGWSPSSPRIVPTPVPSTIVAGPVGLERFTSNVSSPSMTVTVQTIDDNLREITGRYRGDTKAATFRRNFLLRQKNVLRNETGHHGRMRR
jgi:hypothetical protein